MSAAILMSTKKGALETVILPSSDEMNDYIIHYIHWIPVVPLCSTGLEYLPSYTIHGAYMGYTYCYYLSLSHDHQENSRSNMFPVPMECWICVHPWKLTWNPKSWRFGRWFSFSNRWFSGSMFIFQGVSVDQETVPPKWANKQKQICTDVSLTIRPLGCCRLEKPCRANKKTGNPASQIWIFETCL